MTAGGLISVCLTVLGSGSDGNATLLASGETSVLLDAGLSYRELRRRLEGLGCDPDRLTAVLVTHAHGDHMRGAALFSRRHGTPVYATPATREACPGLARVRWEPMLPARVVSIGPFAFHPFVVPHDDIETLAFRIETSEGAVGFATDLGAVTAEVVARFRRCVLLVLEANHAVSLLQMSPYAAPVKARIGSDRGHLSNEALAGFLARHLDRTVACVVLAHLSRVNNVPELAVMTCQEALARARRADVRIVATRQDRVGETIDLAELGRVGPAVRAAVAAWRQDQLPF